VVGVGVADDYTVQLLHAPTPEEIRHLGIGLGFLGVEEVALAAGLDEHPIALPHVYKAHDQRARGRRLVGNRRGQNATAARSGQDEQQGAEQGRDEPA
jgi:hypothetical protein